MQSPIDVTKRKTGTKALILLFMAFLLAFTLGQVALAAPDVNFGDINDDGRIDVRDVVLVMQHILELKELDDDQLKAADVTGDGEINVNDATQIMQYSLGLIDRFTVESAIKSIERVEIDVSYGTAKENIDFPDEVEINLYDESIKDVKVTWEDTSTPEYKKNKYGHYVFRGDLVDLPDDVFNPHKLRPLAVIGVGYQVHPPRPAPTPPPIPDPPPVDSFEDLDGEVIELVPGVYNVEIPYATAEEKLDDVTKDVFLVLYVEGKDPIVLSYDENRDAFFKAAVEGYTEQEILESIVYVWDPEDVTADDLNVAIDQLVPGAYNVTIKLEDAQAKLDNVTEDSTLILNVPDKDPIELEYVAQRDGFFKANVQGYTEDEISESLVVVE